MSRDEEKKPTEAQEQAQATTAQTKQEKSVGEQAASQITAKFHSLISKSIWGK